MRSSLFVRLLTPLLVLALLAACSGPSRVMLGAARPPLDPAQVKVYAQPPAHYEEIAIVEAAGSAFTVGAQRRTDALIERLKEEAAKVGANGIILRGMASDAPGTVGVGTGTTIGWGGIGVGVSAPLSRKRGSALAIYVPQ
ncbi:MAG TPA: hypothetical protein VFB54_05620 [Burkholderiales bacterium]|nr:hypothetical protein [Burkholderiales bacterium]